MRKNIYIGHTDRICVWFDCTSKDYKYFANKQIKFFRDGSVIVKNTRRTRKILNEVGIKWKKN